MLRGLSPRAMLRDPYYMEQCLILLGYFAYRVLIVAPNPQLAAPLNQPVLASVPFFSFEMQCWICIALVVMGKSRKHATLDGRLREAGSYLKVCVCLLLWQISKPAFCWALVLFAALYLLLPTSLDNWRLPGNVVRLEQPQAMDTACGLPEAKQAAALWESVCSTKGSSQQRWLLCFLNPALRECHEFDRMFALLSEHYGAPLSQAAGDADQAGGGRTLRFGRVDVKESGAYADKFNVKRTAKTNHLPTLVLVQNGQVLHRYPPEGHASSSRSAPAWQKLTWDFVVSEFIEPGPAAPAAKKTK